MRLDNSARMNFPGTVEGNWAWRVGAEGIWEKLAQARCARWPAWEWPERRRLSVP